MNDHIDVNVHHHSRNSGGRKQKDAEKREGVEEEPVGGRRELNHLSRKRRTQPPE